MADVAAFGPRERACLAFAEQFVIDVAGLDDAMPARSSSDLGEQGSSTSSTRCWSSSNASVSG